jgi:hypothetical protein
MHDVDQLNQDKEAEVLEQLASVGCGDLETTQDIEAAHNSLLPSRKRPGNFGSIILGAPQKPQTISQSEGAHQDDHYFSQFSQQLKAHLQGQKNGVVEF